MNPNKPKITANKSVQLTIIVIITIWMVGFIFAPNIVELIPNFFGKKFVAFSVMELEKPYISLASLLGFCAACAGFVLVIYTKYSKGQGLATGAYFSTLIMLILVAGTSVSLKLLQVRYILQKYDPLPGSNLSYNSLSFFSWGSPYVALATMLLVYLIDRKHNSKSVIIDNEQY
jgi:hypothetical protein